MNSTAPTCVPTDPHTTHQISSPAPAVTDVTEEHVRVDLPPPRDDHLSDTSDDDTVQDHVRRPRRLSRRVKIFLTSTLAVILLISITFTVRNWSLYEDRRLRYEWTKQPCTLDASKIAEDPSESGKYRIEANVTGLLPNRREHKPAYYGPSAAYSFSKRDAEDKLASLARGSTSCWVKRSDTNSISLVEVPGAEDDIARARSALYVAWTTTFVAAVVGMFTLIFASHWLSEFLGSALGSGGDDDTSSEEMAKNQPYLSRTQSKHVCDEFSSEVKRDQASIAQWVCTVCLDKDQDVSTIRTVLLPCQHRFHRTCIKKWLRRGKGACPLCNWDAKALFDGDGKPSFSDEQAGDVGESHEGGAGEEEGDVERGVEGETVS